MGGDGDHGENMLRGMTAVVNEVEPREFESTADLFKNANASFEKSGECLRNFIQLSIFGIAHAEKEDGTLYQDIKEGLEMIQRRGQAKVGDKTMVDVWAPVVDDLKKIS